MYPGEKGIQVRQSVIPQERCGDGQHKTWLSASKNGMSEKQTSSTEKTRILFYTEGIARNEILSLDRNRVGDTAIRHCKILLVDEAHSSNVDTELIIASILIQASGDVSYP